MENLDKTLQEIMEKMPDLLSISIVEIEDGFFVSDFLNKNNLTNAEQILSKDKNLTMLIQKIGDSNYAYLAILAPQGNIGRTKLILKKYKKKLEAIIKEEMI